MPPNHAVEPRSTVPVPAEPHSSRLSTRPAIGVPAYFGPWEHRHWNRLFVDAPSVVVLNPANGPGPRPSAEYRALRETLHQAGTRVLMYVHTGYLTRDPAAVVADIANALSWFDADGIFLDEVPVDNNRANRSRMDRLIECCAGNAACNTGRVVPSSWFGRYPTVSFVTFEGTPQQLDDRGCDPSIQVLDGPPERQWWLLHSAPLRTHRRWWDHFGSLGLGLAYVTNDRLPNPWDVYVSGRRR